MSTAHATYDSNGTVRPPTSGSTLHRTPPQGHSTYAYASRTTSAPDPEEEEDAYTRFTEEQLDTLEEVFATNPYPSRSEKTRLSEDFGRSEMSVENWCVLSCRCRGRCGWFR